MKNIYRLFTAALVLLGAAACNPSEINNPDNSNQKGKSEITITASIVQTRVAYDYSGLGEVKQHWEENDILFGYYHQKDTDPSTSNQIVFQVVKVDSGTGIATLKVLSPEHWIDNATDKTAVDLVYTGDVDVDVDKLPFSDSGIGIDVDLSGQSLDRVPGCMHAHAELQVKDNKKSLEFKFQNDCALIEIEGLTGVMEEWTKYFSATQPSTGISYVSISNIYLKGSYSYKNDGSLSFETDSSVGSVGEYEIDIESDEWSVDNQGLINGPTGSQGKPQRILIASAPFIEEQDIIVRATINEFGVIPDREYCYEGKLLEQGHCYVITSQPVVAKTADGQYFRSVKAAFDHAEELSTETAYGTAEKNTVTLLREYINGLNEDVAHVKNGSNVSTNIQIDYPVSLDLNGCTLSLDCDSKYYEWDSFYSGGFEVKSGGTLTIDDSKGSGCVDSGSYDCPVISTSGTVNILGGSLSHWESCQVINCTGGTVNVYGGELYAYASPALFLSGSGATGNIFGGYIGNNDDNLSEAIQIFAGADCTISGGIIHSKGNSAAIGCRSIEDDGVISTLTITWPEPPDDVEMDPKSNEEDINEPLIYAAVPGANGSALFGCTPITAHYSDRDGDFDNTAKVKILGGYLISNPNQPWFFSGDGDRDVDYNIDFDNFHGFYSNQTKLLGSGGSNNPEFNLAGDGEKIINKSGYPTLQAIKIEDSSFKMPKIGTYTGELYYIKVK